MSNSKWDRELQNLREQDRRAALPLATCSLPVSSAEAFARWLDKRAHGCRIASQRAHDRGEECSEMELHDEYQCLLSAERDFRREMGLSKERQPAENSEMSQRL